MGFYEDPYSRFGQLAMELWRAARLVVDTGIHSKRWSREEAIAYLVNNTPNAEYDCIKAIERYIAMPGQATAYMIGNSVLLNFASKRAKPWEISLISGCSTTQCLAAARSHLTSWQKTSMPWFESKVQKSKNSEAWSHDSDDHQNGECGE